MKIRLLILLLAALLLSSCSPWNSSGQIIDNDGNRLTGDLQPIPIAGQSMGNGYLVPHLDSATGDWITVSVEHSEIHEGDLYSYSDVFDIPNSGNRTILFITPPGPQLLHLFFEMDAEAEGEMTFYEDTTYSSNGTQVTPINRNRISTNVADSLMYVAPVITSTGTLLRQRHWGSGKATGGATEMFGEFILRPSTNYMLRIVNFTTSPNHCSTEVTWYRHESLN